MRFIYLIFLALVISASVTNAQTLKPDTVFKTRSIKLITRGDVNGGNLFETYNSENRYHNKYPDIAIAPAAKHEIERKDTTIGVVELAGCYIEARNRRHAALRESPFSYLYFANKYGLINRP